MIRNSAQIRVRNQEVAYQIVEVMTGGTELPKGPPGGAEEIKFLQRQTAFRIGALEIHEFPRKLVYNLRIHRLVHTGPHFNVAGVEPNLPGIRWGNDNVTTDELAPVHVVAKRGGKQADSVAALAEDAIGLLEHCDSGPLQI